MLSTFSLEAIFNSGVSERGDFQVVSQQAPAQQI
jgi:hypothetical protein